MRLPLDDTRSRIAPTAAGLIFLVGSCAIQAVPEPTTRPTPAPLPTLNPDRIAQGRAIYSQFCASCHGANAEGAPNWEQPDARGDLPAPPHDDSGHTWRHSDTQLAEIILGGLRDPFNKTPELTMPPFSGRLTDDDVGAVLTYFKSLWSAEHREFQEQQNRRPSMPLPSPSATP